MTPLAFFTLHADLQESSTCACASHVCLWECMRVRVSARVHAYHRLHKGLDTTLQPHTIKNLELSMKFICLCRYLETRTMLHIILPIWNQDDQAKLRFGPNLAQYGPNLSASCINTTQTRAQFGGPNLPQLGPNLAQFGPNLSPY